MPWVCENCSTSNADTLKICFVCDAPKNRAKLISSNPDVKIDLTIAVWPEDKKYELLKNNYEADGYSEIVPCISKGKHCYGLVIGDKIKQLKMMSHLLLMEYAK